MSEIMSHPDSDCHGKSPVPIENGGRLPAAAPVHVPEGPGPIGVFDPQASFDSP
jgi:hypothetical protein